MSVFLFGSGGSSGMELIFSTTLTTDAATITTGTLPTGYKSLLVKTLLKSDDSHPQNTRIILNGNTTDTDYQGVRIFSEAFSAGVAHAQNRVIGVAVGSAVGAADMFSAMALEVYNHENTTQFKNYTLLDSTNGAVGVSAATNFLNSAGGVFRNTAAITRIGFDIANSADFVAGSTLFVYGLK